MIVTPCAALSWWGVIRSSLPGRFGNPVAAIVLSMLNLACSGHEPASPPRPVHHLELVQRHRVDIPDSLQFTGLAVDSRGETLVAWGPDYPGFWSWQASGNSLGWRYVHPVGWQGTVGALAGGEDHGLVAVDSAGQVSAVKNVGVSGGEVAVPTSAVTGLVSSGGRLASTVGTVNDPIAIVATDDGLWVRHGTDATAVPPPPVPSLLRPILVGKRGPDGWLVLPRDPFASGMSAAHGGRYPLGRIGDHPILARQLNVDTNARWTLAGAVDLGGGLLVTLADLRSENRILARFDDQMALLACRTLATPYAVVAGTSDGRYAVAGVWDRGGIIIVYAVRSGAVYAEPVVSCDS